jgi:hypothetical protein
MRAAAVAVAALVAGLAATPAFAGGQSVDVRISAHLRSDYRFAYDFVDTSSPDCPETINTSSRVVTDMTTVRPTRFRITRLNLRGRVVYQFVKRGGGPRLTRWLDMRATMTRSTQGGSSTPCFGTHTYPTVKCGTRTWALDGQPGITTVTRDFVVAITVPPFPSLERFMADEEWRDGGCGYDGTQANEYITVSRDNAGRIKSPYLAPVSVRRLFRPGPRTLRLRDEHPFTQGRPDQPGGGFTEVRTVEITVRKLR